MGFNFTDAARGYWRKLNDHSKSGKLEILFDLYYLSFIVGCLKKELFEEEKLGTEFIDAFPESYYDQKEQIIALLISTEIERKGIDPKDRTQIQKTMLNYVKPDSTTRLSKKGETVMKQYAQKGFQIIKDKIPNPFNVDTFIIRYFGEIIKKLEWLIVFTYLTLFSFLNSTKNLWKAFLEVISYSNLT